MAPKTKSNTIANSLDNMSIEDLAQLSERIHDLIESKKTAEAIAADILVPACIAKIQRMPKRQDSVEWFETKTIHGHQYRYRRWWENGKKRSEYLGKA